MVPERLCTGAEWPMPGLNPKLSALALVAPLIGCASRQPEGGPYIVLHPHPAERVVAHNPPRSKPKPSMTAASSIKAPLHVRTASNACPGHGPVVDPQPLTPAEKEELFRRFDAYLSQSGHQ